MRENSRIYIAGHNGMVGSALLRRLESEGYTNLITRSHSDLDLTDQQAVADFFRTEKPEYVFLAAAKVGGILANSSFPADFIYLNLMIQTNVLHESYRAGVKRLLFLGSSCIYPKLAPQPIKEEYLLTSELEPTNEPYAVAKIAGLKMCHAYNRQYGTNFIPVMPTNLYGPNDNYDLETSHALPAMIRKFHLAKLAAAGEWESIERDELTFGPIPKALKSNLAIPTPSITLWGTGSPFREWLHVDDMADACLFILKRDKKAITSVSKSPNEPVFNIGCGKDISIAELAHRVSQAIGYSGDIHWDKTKPDGTPKKLLDVNRLKELGWTTQIPLNEGIKGTYEHYKSQVQ